MRKNQTVTKKPEITVLTETETKTEHMVFILWKPNFFDVVFYFIKAQKNRIAPFVETESQTAI